MAALTVRDHGPASGALPVLGPLEVRERRPPAERTIRRSDPSYPPWLAEVEPPPAVLHAVGDVSLLAGPAVAVVGSRAATGLGRRMAELLGAGLAARGAVVVSGLARGIDAAAHAGALSVGGATVAVLGGGLDVAVPRSTRRLGARIAREGCVVTEYPAGVPPLKHHFPARNRIVAGLARVVVVVEAGPRSGALITARLALESGREVMAVPAQPLASNAAGVNRLLREGAGPVRSPADVLEELLLLPGAAAALEARLAGPAGDEPDEREPAVAAGPRPADPPAALRPVLDAMGVDPIAAGLVAERAGLEIGATLAALTRLEMAGLVRMVPGRLWQRAAP